MKASLVGKPVAWADDCIGEAAASVIGDMKPGDVALICVSAFVICSVAALVPAYFAARLDPVQALMKH